MLDNNVVSGGPAFNIPAGLSFGKYVFEEMKAKIKEEKIVMVNANNNSQTKLIQLLQEIVDVCAVLRAQSIGKADVVGICSENSKEFIAVLVAASCCGATVTPLNFTYIEGDMLNALNVSYPKVVFCSEKFINKYIKLFKSTPCIERIIQIGGDSVDQEVSSYDSILNGSDLNKFEPVDVNGAEDTAFIFYSSGTTGLPKGVQLTHHNVIHGIKMNIDDYKNEQSNVLAVPPWFHVYGLFTAIKLITENKTIVFMSEFDPELYVQTIHNYQITILIAVPPIIVYMVKLLSIGNYDCSSVRLILCAGAHLSLKIISDITKWLPNCKGISQGYGLTETSLMVLKLTKSMSVLKEGSCGHPLPGVHVKVVDVQTGEKLGPHEQGEIRIGSPSNMKGYLRSSQETDIVDEEGFLKSGDTGYYDEDGYFFITGRIKEIIKYKGHQVSPTLIESILLQHSGVLECGVIGKPDELAGELPTAFVVPKPGVTLTQRDLLDFSNERLSSSNRLRGGIIFVREVPKNSMGKIQRRELKNLLANEH